MACSQHTITQVCHLVCSSRFDSSDFIWGLIDIWHDGDEPNIEEPDFGLFQIDATRDRKEICGNFLFVATTFGDHVLHHLFPTLDHSKLPLIYEVFEKTCEEFKVNMKYSNYPSMAIGLEIFRFIFDLFIYGIILIVGMYRQLSRTEPHRCLKGKKE